MKYNLECCLWELTRDCNMNCDICLCGSKKHLKEELSASEALALCQEFADLHVKRVVLTGGEPLVREDWDVIAKRLTDLGVHAELISNGYLIDEAVIARMKRAGIRKVTISVDGSQQVHDKKRMPGSFEKCREAFLLLNKTDITVHAASTISQDNYDDLVNLRGALVEMGVKNWDIHLGLPYGNFMKNGLSVLSVEQIRELIDFCYQTHLEYPGLSVYPGDSIGYYTTKEVQVRSCAAGSETICVFAGCPSGISLLNILYNGNVTSCSLCLSRFVAGNIRETPLRQLWEDDDNAAWSWRRKLKKEQLSKTCRECAYGDVCLGGCLAVRNSLSKDIFGENSLCVYGAAAQPTA